MLNRTIQPPISEISTIELPNPQQMMFPNKIPYHVINMGDEEVIRLDLVFNIGAWNQPRPFVARLTNLMLKNGSSLFSAEKIAEHFDFHGSFINLANTHHNSTVTVYSLSKHLDETLYVLEDLVKNPTFPQEEIDIAIKKKKQQLLVDEEKVEYKSSVKFREVLFGKNHPYGTSITPGSLVSPISTSELTDFFESGYNAANVRIMISGKIDDNAIKTIENHVGNKPWGNNSVLKDNAYTPLPSSEKRHLVPKKDAVQASVIIGRTWVDNSHPDFHKLKVLNTLLGGYFGSRLMTNIREEKGYTYGIGSGYTSMRYGSYFFISSQTAVEHTESLINEVYIEMDKLRSSCVSNKELDMVKHYMLGEITRSYEGAFSLAEQYNVLINNNIDFSDIRFGIEEIKAVKPKDIQQLAEKYLRKDSFYEIIAG